LSFTTKQLADLLPPNIIEGPTITSITHNSAVVEWKTDEPATSEVIGSFSDTIFKTEHRVPLSSLQANQTYSIQVRATDRSNNGPTTSPSVSFTTLSAPDVLPPVIIAGPMIMNVTHSTALIVWETDEPSVSGVSYNNGVNYFLVRDEVPQKKHEVFLTSLEASKTYFFTVSSTDTLGNGPSLSTQQSFKTLSAPDTSAPALLDGIKIVGVTHKSAVIHWETDEPSNGALIYGLNSSQLNESANDSGMKEKHQHQLTNLQSNTIYYIKIESTDAAGNTGSSTVYSFTTQNLPDTTAPEFTLTPTLTSTGKNRVVIDFETNEPTEYQLFYGEGSDRSMQISDGTKNKKHQVKLSNLEANKTYGFKVIVKDPAGNVTIHEGN